MAKSRYNPVRVAGRSLGYHPRPRRKARGGQPLKHQKFVTHLISPAGTALCSSGEGKLTKLDAKSEGRGVLTCGRCINLLAMMQGVGRQGPASYYRPGGTTRKLAMSAKREQRGTSYAVPGGRKAWRDESDGLILAAESYKKSRYAGALGRSKGALLAKSWSGREVANPRGGAVTFRTKSGKIVRFSAKSNPRGGASVGRSARTGRFVKRKK